MLHHTKRPLKLLLILYVSASHKMAPSDEFS